MTTRSTHDCDFTFSQLVRERAGWICVCCKADFSNNHSALSCSHYFNRRKMSVRYDPRNADALCSLCHIGPNGWEYQKNNGAYKNHMILKLGLAGLEKFQILAETHMSPDTAKAEFLAKLKGGTLWEETQQSLELILVTVGQ